MSQRLLDKDTEERLALHIILKIAKGANPLDFLPEIIAEETIFRIVAHSAFQLHYDYKLVRDKYIPEKNEIHNFVTITSENGRSSLPRSSGWLQTINEQCSVNYSRRDIYPGFFRGILPGRKPPGGVSEYSAAYFNLFGGDRFVLGLQETESLYQFPLNKIDSFFVLIEYEDRYADPLVALLWLPVPQYFANCPLGMVSLPGIANGSSINIKYYFIENNDLAKSIGEKGVWMLLPSNHFFCNGNCVDIQKNRKLDSPKYLFPGNNSNDIDYKNLTLRWTGSDPDGDKLKYFVYFEANNPDPQDLVSDPEGQDSTIFNLGDLLPDTQYYWRIAVEDERGLSNDSDVWSFTTSPPPNNPPYEPNTPYPANGALDQDNNTDLLWVGGDPDGDSVYYDVFLEADNPDPTLLISSRQTSSSYDPGSLDLDTQYFWKIVAYDEHDATTEGPVWNFTTMPHPNDPPNTPSNPSPDNGAIDQSTDTNLSWSGGDPDGDFVTYDVYFDADNPDPNLLMSDLPSEIFDPGPLYPNTHYYWKIIAKDEYEAVTGGPVWDFTTGSDEPPGSWQEVGTGSASGGGITDTCT